MHVGTCVHMHTHTVLNKPYYLCKHQPFTEHIYIRAKFSAFPLLAKPKLCDHFTYNLHLLNRRMLFFMMSLKLYLLKEARLEAESRESA